jgi:hypothetical protein
MSIRAMSSLFPSAPDSPFVVTAEVPVVLADVLFSSSGIHCPKCNAYTLQAEQICPICFPSHYFGVRKSTFFNSFKIASRHPPPVPRPYLLLLDLDVREDSLFGFVRMLIEEARRTPDFGNARFYVGFVSQHVTFCHHAPNDLRFCFVPSFENLQDCEETLLSHAEYLEVAATHAKSSLKATAEKSVPLRELFDVLLVTRIMEDLQDIVYVFSGAVANLEYDFGPRLHLVQIASEPNEKTIQFALKANATYSLETQINANTLESFKSCLAPNLLYRHIQVFTSQGISLKSVYGPVKTTTITQKGSIVELKLFSRAIPPYFFLRGTKVPEAYVSIQMVFDVFESQLFVMNWVWRKAIHPAEWAASVDHAWCVAPFIQLKAAEAFKDLRLVSRWSIPDGTFRFPKEAVCCRKRAEHLEKLILLLVRRSEIFSDAQRSYFLLSAFYGATRYYDELYEALTKSPIDGPYLIIPPYIAFAEEATSLGIAPLKVGMTPIKLPPRAFGRLRNAIHDLRSELTLLESAPEKC